MKTKFVLIAFFLLTISLSAQTTENYLFKLGETNIGGYIGLNTKMTSLRSDPAGFLDLRGAITLNGNWAIGLGVSALYYDKKLTGLVEDGTYHLGAGYAGLFIERIFTLDDNLKLSVSLLMANGLTNYLYDKDYRSEKVWYERKIDETTFFLWEPQLEVQYRIGEYWWLGVNTSIRSTSPVEMIGTDESIFRNFSVGVTAKYGLF